MISFKNVISLAIICILGLGQEAYALSGIMTVQKGLQLGNQQIETKLSKGVYRTEIDIQNGNLVLKLIKDKHPVTFTLPVGLKLGAQSLYEIDLPAARSGLGVDIQGQLELIASTSEPFFGREECIVEGKPLEREVSYHMSYKTFALNLEFNSISEDEMTTLAEVKAVEGLSEKIYEKTAECN